MKNYKKCAKYVFAMMFALILNIHLITVSYAEEVCGSVKECAQEMVKIANNLKEENKKLVNEILVLRNALAQQSQDINAKITARFNQLGNGSDVIPSWGNIRSTFCSAGYYMVGSKLHKVGGGNAGALYYTVEPVCRKFN